MCDGCEDFGVGFGQKCGELYGFRGGWGVFFDTVGVQQGERVDGRYLKSL